VHTTGVRNRRPIEVPSPGRTNPSGLIDTRGYVSVCAERPARPGRWIAMANSRHHCCGRGGGSSLCIARSSFARGRGVELPTPERICPGRGRHKPLCCA